jgi:hypothetical protein
MANRWQRIGKGTILRTQGGASFGRFDAAGAPSILGGVESRPDSGETLGSLERFPVYRACYLFGALDMDDTQATRNSLLIRLRDSDDARAWSEFVEIPD